MSLLNASEEYDSLTPLPVIPNMRQVRSVELTPSAVEQRLDSKNGQSNGQIKSTVNDMKHNSHKLVHSYRNGYCHYTGGSKKSNIKSQGKQKSKRLVTNMHYIVQCCLFKVHLNKQRP